MHISEVPSGLACECTCTGCNAVLVARKGKQKAHHFAHHHTDDCGLAFESALHQYAKELISEKLCLFLPEVRAEYKEESECIREAKVITFDCVETEQAMGSIRPDIIASKAGHDLLIEVAVTHFCDDDKINHLNERGLAAVEIDLSSLSWDVSKEEWGEAILMDAPRKWLSNSKIDAARSKLKEKRKTDKEAAQRQVEKEKQIKLLRIQRQADILIGALEGVYEPIFVPSHFNRDVDNVLQAGFDGIVGVKIRGDVCFTAEPKVWQTCIVSSFVVLAIKRGQFQTMFSTKKLYRWVKQKGFLRKEFASFIHEAASKEVQQKHPEFQPPYDAIQAYLEHLTKMDVLTFYRGRWHLTWLVKQEFKDANMF